MKKQILSFSSLILISVYSYGCGSNSTTSTNETADTTKFPPVETKAANTNYKPAFKGQTRAPGVKTTTPYKVDKIAENLGRPWAIIPMPDGRLLMTEKKGFMMIHDANGGFVKKITGLPAVEDGGQGGLLDVALDPDFSKNKMIYWSFSEKQGSGNLMAVAKGQLNEAAGTVQNSRCYFQSYSCIK